MTGRALMAAVLAACIALVSSGCAGRHFHDAGEPQVPLVRYTLDTLPNREYWTGILFNGTRIGFTHSILSPSKTRGGCYEIRGQAFMKFRFLTMDKKVSVNTIDLVDRELRLVSFAHEYTIDDSLLKVTGELKDGVLKIRSSSGKTGSEDEFSVQGELYPLSASAFYPLLQGLSKGRTYACKVYDGETRTIVDMTQEILAYERSGQFDGEAFRVRTRYLGQEIITWVNEQGLPVFESALGGVLLSRLENEEQARRYLVEAGLNKDESLLEFSLIRVGTPIPDPARVKDMEVWIDGIPEEMTLPCDGRQVCVRRGDRVLCSIKAGKHGEAGISKGDERSAPEHLMPSGQVPSNSPEIISLAGKITQGAQAGEGQARALLAWIGKNIGKEPVDVFSALDVLAGKKGECQGHAYLYAALARALGLPTRVVNGIVYAHDFKGFLYHAWAESFLNGSWVAVDPTMGQMPADATHVKFVEGEALSSLVPLVGVMGRISIEVGHAK